MIQLNVEVEQTVSRAEVTATRFAAAAPRKSSIALLLTLQVAAVFAWLSALRTPLWLDETVSYWQIAGGFSKIWARQGLSFPAYSYVLWLQRTIFGASSYSLRAPSIVAMIAAVYVLYRIARRFFDAEMSLLVGIVFSVHPIVVFAAIDARPYAMGILVVNCAVLSLLKWIETDETRYALCTGLLTGLIFYFHYLFSVIILAFVILRLVRVPERKLFVRQMLQATAVFAVVMIPVIAGLRSMVATRSAHVFAAAPTYSDLLETLTPGDLVWIFPATFLVAAALREIAPQNGDPRVLALTSLLLAFVPIGILYVGSIATPLHAFVPRYRLVAIPGIALCWGLLISHIRSSAIRTAFCALLVLICLEGQYLNPSHSYSWKRAIEVANAASSDGAPLLVCSDLPESNSWPLPTGDARESGMFAQFSYYPVHSPVVPLPRELNETSKAAVQKFLSENRHKRFIGMGFSASWSTLQWIADATKDTYAARPLAAHDGVMVVEYMPR